MPSSVHPATWLVTGTSRGIGLEIVRQLLESSHNVVIAACRTPEKASALQDLGDTAKGTLHIIQIDVSDVESIRGSAKELERILGPDTGLDYLVNNAGVAAYEDSFEIDPDVFLSVFRTNTLGPAMMSQVALPFLERGSTKKILHISSVAGSVGSADPFGGKYPTYSSSKSALNMLAYKQKLARPDLIVIPLCPGPVKTDMNDKYGKLEPHESVSGILKVITSATAADSGRFLRYNGETIPW
ncbi:C-signal [Trametes polyzona]|nr:C-signal [Trametes polyzona]